MHAVALEAFWLPWRVSTGPYGLDLGNAAWTSRFLYNNPNEKSSEAHFVKKKKSTDSVKQ